MISQPLEYVGGGARNTVPDRLAGKLESAAVGRVVLGGFAWQPGGREGPSKARDGRAS